MREESVPAKYEVAFALLARGVDEAEPRIEQQRRGLDMLHELAETFPGNIEALFLAGKLSLGDKRTSGDEFAKLSFLSW